MPSSMLMNQWLPCSLVEPSNLWSGAKQIQLQYSSAWLGKRKSNKSNEHDGLSISLAVILHANPVTLAAFYLVTNMGLGKDF
jgi:hypothetical protein